MAVHNNNDGEKQENKAGTQVSDPILSQTTGSSGGPNWSNNPNPSPVQQKNFFNRGVYNTGSASSGKQVELLKEACDAIIEEMKSELTDVWGVSVTSTIVFKGHDNPLITDALAITLSKNGKSVTSAIILHGNETIPPFTVNCTRSQLYRGTRLKVVRTMRDLDSENFRKHLKKQFRNSEIFRSVSITAELEKSAKTGLVVHTGKNPLKIEGIIVNIIQGLGIRLGMDVLDEVEDIKISDLAAFGGIVTLGIHELKDTRTTVDGIIINPKVEIKFAAGRKRNADQRSRDVHDAASAQELCSLFLTTEVRHVPAQPQAPQLGATMGAPVYYNNWSPTLIVDDITLDGNNQPTTGVEMLVFAMMTGFITPDILMAMFSDDVRFLSVVSNVTQNAKGGKPISKQAMNDHFATWWKLLFTKEFSIGIRTRTCTSKSIMHTEYPRLAASVKGLHITKHLSKELGRTVTPKDIINPWTSVQVQGYYTENNQTLPLSNIDIRYWLKEFPNEVALHREWLLAQTTELPLEERLAIQTALIQKGIPGAVITGSDVISYLTTNAVKALRAKMVGSISLETSDATLDSRFQDLSFAYHGAGIGGFDFSNVNIGGGSSW